MAWNQSNFKTSLLDTQYFSTQNIITALLFYDNFTNCVKSSKIRTQLVKTIIWLQKHIMEKTINWLCHQGSDHSGLHKWCLCCQQAMTHGARQKFLQKGTRKISLIKHWYDTMICCMFLFWLVMLHYIDATWAQWWRGFVFSWWMQSYCSRGTKVFLLTWIPSFSRYFCEATSLAAR